MRTLIWTFCFAMASSLVAPLRQASPEQSITRELARMVSAAPVELATNPVTIHVSIPVESRAFLETAAVPTSRMAIILHIDGITFDQRPDAHYQVFLNLPQSEPPSYKSVYFVGNLSFFLPYKPSPDHPASVGFDVTPVLRQLQSRKAWNPSELSVTFVPRWLEDREGHPLPLPSGVRVRFTTLKILARP